MPLNFDESCNLPKCSGLESGTGPLLCSKLHIPHQSQREKLSVISKDFTL